MFTRCCGVPVNNLVFRQRLLHVIDAVRDVGRPAVAGDKVIFIMMGCRCLKG
jgi:hypothetical protein